MSKIDDEVIARYARALGMKCAEVLDVVESADGDLVRTHDGQWTLIRDDGTMRPAEAPEVVFERDSGVFVGESRPEVFVPDSKGTIVPAKPAAKRRGRS